MYVWSAIIGAVTGLALSRYFYAKPPVRDTDAYEEGWSHGYEIGLNAPRPKRAKTIRAKKAD